MELPDDASAWPADPFAVLGVARGAADADIKRAYTRLLRRFKPERFPAQFQRLRECYEACLSQSPWYRSDDPADDTGDTAPYILDLPRQAKPPDAVDAAWKLATEGRTAEAYSALCEAHRSYPDRRDVPLRLYWLLAIAPDLDPERTRLAWLVTALQTARLAGPAVELYRRELDADPEAALGGTFQKLLAAPAEPADVLRVAGLRVAAAARARLGKRLFDDVHTLRGRAVEFADPAWLAFLVQVSGWTAWGGFPMVADAVRIELKKLAYLELPQSYAFDRMDEARLAAEAGKELVKIGLPAVAALLRLAWAGEGGTDAEVVAAATELLADDVRAREWLGHLVARLGPHPLLAVARQFADYLGGPPDREPVPPEVMRAAARRFGPAGRWEHYFPNRQAVVAALAAEGFDPADFAAAMADDPEVRFREYFARLADDLALRVSWLALRVVKG